MKRPPPRSTLFPYTTLFRSAAQRLLQKLTSESPVVFVCTLILEPAKRPGWTQGFTSQFPLPAGQSHRSYAGFRRSEEHTSELQSHVNLVCRLLLEKKKKKQN